MAKALGLAVLLISLSGMASAKDHPVICTALDNYDPNLPILSSNFCAPEMDPGSAMTGLTMLLGGLAVVRGRRSKTSKP